MFITEDQVFVQLQKTGSTHIALLLAKTVGGKQEGHHERPQPSLLSSTRRFIASIRNPWTWYLSLWSYGCDDQGGVHERLLNSTNASYWQECYRDSGDPTLFRNWLSMIYDPHYSGDLGEGYADSGISGLAGFYTFRFLTLCCRFMGSLQDHDVHSIEELEIFEKYNCYISSWIRMESLEDDFIHTVSSAGIKLNDQHQRLVRSHQKSNTSRRQFSPSVYYDERTIGQVRKKEQIIVKKFGYVFPED